ncbi:MAG: hypothetical protein AAFX05_02315 [Planctomycetota bacterium]
MSCGCKPRTGPDFDPEFEGPSDADVARFSDETIPCPSCGESVYDEATMCQRCGHIMGDAVDSRGKPLFVAVGIITLVAFVVVWVL